ncbi:MAG TPA: arylamine N-acetyltransferase [Bryobacteraceae bacterium]|jgi:N-hydroxyarylamine O-acetyltransferase|nr:arylamine N-acetyltransferase [Bryobacteraceae bacterium]
MVDAIDLAAYGERIGFAGELRPSAECLRELHLAHATHVPFENIEVLMGRPVRLDLASLWQKLVAERRGGYCFEQNTLFAAVLETVGFRVRRLAARVRLGGPGVSPRTHMLLAVEADGGEWLCDVGFGGDALLLPVAWDPGATSEQFAWKYRLMPEGSGFVLQTLQAEAWADLYAFTREKQFAIDYEMANYYTATHPDSFFRKQLFAHLPGPEVRLTLFGRRLTERRPDGVTATELADDAAVVAVLAARFGLHFPEGTVFPLVTA